MCTSHLISQNFAKAFGIMFQNREGVIAYPYLTSWGFTTRSIGAVVMAHGDQKGLILPPKVAPIQVIIIPIFVGNTQPDIILTAVQKLAQQLNSVARVAVDDDQQKSPGSKFYAWELKGVPIRIEIGPRDITNGTVVIADRLGIAKETVPLDQVCFAVQKRLELIQQKMYDRAKERFMQQWHKGAKLTEFGPGLVADGGFYQTGWCRRPTCEAKLKEYSATIRCLRPEKEFSECFNCSQSSPSDILVAKSY